MKFLSTVKLGWKGGTNKEVLSPHLWVYLFPILNCNIKDQFMCSLRSVDKKLSISLSKALNQQPKDVFPSDLQSSTLPTELKHSFGNNHPQEILGPETRILVLKWTLDRCDWHERTVGPHLRPRLKETCWKDALHHTIKWWHTKNFIGGCSFGDYRQVWSKLYPVNHTNDLKSYSLASLSLFYF